MFLDELWELAFLDNAVDLEATDIFPSPHTKLYFQMFVIFS